jgi:hypothetical protein
LQLLLKGFFKELLCFAKSFEEMNIIRSSCIYVLASRSQDMKNPVLQTLEQSIFDTKLQIVCDRKLSLSSSSASFQAFSDHTNFSNFDSMRCLKYSVQEV